MQRLPQATHVLMKSDLVMVDIGHGSAIFSTPQPSIAQLLKKGKGANYKYYRLVGGDGVAHDECFTDAV